MFIYWVISVLKTNFYPKSSLVSMQCHARILTRRKQAHANLYHGWKLLSAWTPGKIYH